MAFYIGNQNITSNDGTWGNNEVQRNTVAYLGPNGYIPSVRIGHQIWMLHDLAVSHFKDGEPLVHWSESDGYWGATADNAYMNESRWYGTGGGFYTDHDLDARTGFFYPCNVIYNSHGIAPEGWRVPNLADWEALFDHCEAHYGVANTGDATSEIALKCLKIAGRDRVVNQGGHWDEGTETNPEQLNLTGFSMVGSGYRLTTGSLGMVGRRNTYWVDEPDTEILYGHCMFFIEDAYPEYKDNSHDWGINDKDLGYQIRCMRDAY